MKAVVFHAAGDIRVDEVPEPQIQEATDAIVRLTSSAVCGTDLHSMDSFPIGIAMYKNLTINMGNCDHRKYIPHLVELVRTGAVVPSALITQVQDIEDAVEAYRCFDRRESGWMKVELAPAG